MCGISTDNVPFFILKKEISQKYNRQHIKDPFEFNAELRPLDRG